MEQYNNGLTDTLVRNYYNQIRHQPQPDYFPQENVISLSGGKRVRAHPLPGYSEYDTPSSLAVGQHIPTHYEVGYQGGSSKSKQFWKDFGHGFTDTMKTGAQIAQPVATELAKSALTSYMLGAGKKPRGRPRGSTKGGKKSNILKSIGNAFHSVASHPITQDALHTGYQMAKDIVVPVATEYGKQALKSYLTGQGRKRGRPSKSGGALITNHPAEFQNSSQGVYPPALLPEFMEHNARRARGGKINWRKVKQGAIDTSKAIAPYAPLLLMAAGRKQKKAKLPSSEHKRLENRGLIVGDLMRKQGMTLGQASKYVKENGLY